MKVGPYEFPHVSYDSFGDVLYLRFAKGTGGIGVGDTPEGHAFLCPDDGPDEEVVGVDVMFPAEQLDRTGRIEITLPDGSVERLPEAESLVRSIRPFPEETTIALTDGRELRGPFRYLGNYLFEQIFFGNMFFTAYDIAEIRFDRSDA